MIAKLSKKLQKNDNAVSAVIGTILMIAVTVVLGGVIYAAVGGFGAKELGGSDEAAVFRATAIDTDADGKTDSIQLRYFSGPGQLSPTLKLNNVGFAGCVWDSQRVAVDPAATYAAPGDTCVITSYDADADPTPLSEGPNSIIITVNGKVVFDTSVVVAELNAPPVVA